MYKDKDKQRDAQRNWVRQKRAVKGSTGQGSTEVKLVGDLPPKEQAMVLKVLSPPKPKRGKNIKCFADLSLDIKKTIVRLTTNPDGSIDHAARANRIAIAIDYQHKHPDRYHSTGAVFTGSMTVMERLFYRPANELKPGEHNFASLPGRACHGVY